MSQNSRALQWAGYSIVDRGDKQDTDYFEPEWLAREIDGSEAVE